ncbi:MAG: M20/M25/M40 family metallo-hydrolase [Bacteroidetes bacterium]|nr:MAG: M20/M25/M40 family metallo-hydrolase [Bacteroidota bacterium]
MIRLLIPLVCLLCSSAWLHAQPESEPVDKTVNELIRKHGLEQSQVMDIAFWLTDVYGPRLTGSPQLDRATEWAMQTLESWGLENVHTETWGPFGRGWELEHFEMHGHDPLYHPIIAYPKAWSSSTNGLVRGEVVYLDASSEEELEQYRGKLKGKFVLLDTLRVVEEWFDPLARRFDDSELLEMANAAAPAPRRGNRRFRGSGYSFTRKLWEFLYEEQPLCVIDRSYKGDLGTVFLSSARVPEGRPWQYEGDVLPQVTMAIEHYNRIFRMLKKGLPVTLSMELKARYTNPDGMEANIIAEIPGTDLKDEVVMFGAHFDSWHAATGATDNAAGSAVMMEVARILMKVIEETGQRPRRTLRLALWTGEEQGLYGSRAYVRDHFAVAKEGAWQAEALKPAQENISAYYNLDNGTGRIRGVYLQGNAAVAPIFRAWLDEFRDLDAATLTLSNTGGTDHLAFDAVGIPGFQFIQDPIAYWSRTHHSNMDNYDHLVADDLKQAATIIASFVWHTAQRDEKLPRKPTDLKIVPAAQN